jgi:sec-independent protein translocase protein TatA
MPHKETWLKRHVSSACHEVRFIGRSRCIKSHTAFHDTPVIVAERRGLEIERVETMGSLSIGHWLVVFIIVALIFGTKRLRNIGGDISGAVTSFKNAARERDEHADHSRVVEQRSQN